MAANYSDIGNDTSHASALPVLHRPGVRKSRHPNWSRYDDVNTTCLAKIISHGLRERSSIWRKFLPGTIISPVSPRKLTREHDVGSTGGRVDTQYVYLVCLLFMDLVTHCGDVHSG